MPSSLSQYRWIAGDRECSIGQPTTPARGALVSIIARSDSLGATKQGDSTSAVRGQRNDPLRYARKDEFQDPRPDTHRPTSARPVRRVRDNAKSHPNRGLAFAG